jgi:hypothetical protein
MIFLFFEIGVAVQQQKFKETRSRGEPDYNTRSGIGVLSCQKKVSKKLLIVGKANLWTRLQRLGKFVRGIIANRIRTTRNDILAALNCHLARAVS